jgi:hypothetical protein
MSGLILSIACRRGIVIFTGLVIQFRLREVLWVGIRGGVIEAAAGIIPSSPRSTEEVVAGEEADNYHQCHHDTNTSTSTS